MILRLRDVVAWDAAEEITFAFYEGETALRPLHARLGVMQLLLESARLRDEGERSPRKSKLAPKPADCTNIGDWFKNL